MDSIKLKNFRCFHGEQEATLRPLTLLVGENSTGKTSFMAMIRALYDMANDYRIPDFKEEPYDLGSFDEIAHNRGARGSHSDTFEAEMVYSPWIGERPEISDRQVRFRILYGSNGTIPILLERRFECGETWSQEIFSMDEPSTILVGTSRGSWQTQVQQQVGVGIGLYENRMFPLFYFIERRSREEQQQDMGFEPLQGSPRFTSEDWESLETLFPIPYWHNHRRPFAGAPVRSKPRRMYDPSRPVPDPEGDYVPTYLANMFFRNRNEWETLKDRLEEFGRSAGLFDEIYIKPLGKKDSGGFQVQVRKFGRRLKGPGHNLIDVGYGVSQALPVVTELLRSDDPDMFLLQQPEVHLHPSAQAAMGSLFCQLATPNRQLIVETHSDHLMNRILADVRDGVSGLKAEDISILFFERRELDIVIHSLQLDKEGNVRHAPDTYRRFFLEETARLLELQ